MLSSAAVGSPQRAASSAVDASKPRRSRKKGLTTVDRRSRVSRRITELQALFLSALERAGAVLTPMRRMRLEEAAQLKALAEKARGDYLRDAVGSLDDVVRIERKADAAVRAIGLPSESSRPAPPSLADYMKSVAPSRASEETA